MRLRKLMFFAFLLLFIYQVQAQQIPAEVNRLEVAGNILVGRITNKETNIGIPSLKVQVTGKGPVPWNRAIVCEVRTDSTGIFTIPYGVNEQPDTVKLYVHLLDYTGRVTVEVMAKPACVVETVFTAWTRAPLIICKAREVNSRILLTPGTRVFTKEDIWRNPNR